MIGSGAGTRDAARQRKWMAHSRARRCRRRWPLKSRPVSVSTAGPGHAKDQHITVDHRHAGLVDARPDARVGAHLSGIPDSTSALPRHEYRFGRTTTAYARRSARGAASTESFDAYFQRHLPDAPAEEAPPPASRGGRAPARRRAGRA